MHILSIFWHFMVCIFVQMIKYKKVCIFYQLFGILMVCIFVQGVSKNGDAEKVIATIVNIFQQIPAAGPRFIEVLCQLILQNEKAMLIGASSPFREPLMNFLLRYPDETMQLFLQDNNIKVGKSYC